MRIQRQKPSAQKWFLFFFFGLIGAAIAGARKGASLRFEIPYCEDCYRRERILLWVTWGAWLLGLLSTCGFAMLVTQLEEPYDPVSVVGALGMLIGAPVLLIAAAVLGIVWRAHKAVHIKRIYERSESVRLTFRNPSYFERFWRDNLERIVSLALRHGKRVPFPLDQAITAVSRHIDEQDPRSPESLKGYFERGQLYLQAGMYDRALADLDWVVGVTGFENPYFLEAQLFRGQAHMQLGNSMQAQTDLENYVQASSDRARVRQARQWLKQLRRA